MRTVPSQLAEHIAGDELTLATCWRIARADGVVLGFTDHDIDLEVDGVVYHAATGFSRSALETTGRLEVSSLNIEGLIDSDLITSEDLRSGLYRGAEVRTFRVNWAAIDQGILKLLRGTIGRITVTDIGYTAEVEGLTKRLQMELVEVLTTDCLADLGDARCKVDLAAFTSTGAVLTIVNATTFTHGLSVPEHWHSGGVLTWTTGNNAGRTSEVRYDSGSSFELFLPTDYPVEVGNGFSVQAGCDKLHTTCREKFDNFLNFRGHGLHVPGEDEFLYYPDAPEA